MPQDEIHNKDMKPRNPSSLRTFLFLLLLAIGPLQAQAVFACTVMDMPVHDNCCCDEHKSDDSCGNADCHPNLKPGENPCCERNLQVSVNEDVKEDTPVVKPAEVRSDVDPPPAIAVPFDTQIAPRPLLALLHPIPPPAALPGSRTYLITQRLRI